MSTTIEMTSPSSSIVVVDKSGSAEANNLIQTSASQHHLYHHPHQSHQIHAQQVIVNEEYLSADNLNYLKSNDLLNNAQIIQSTASFDFGQRRGEAQLISGKTVHHQQQLHHPKGATSATSIVGHTQDDLYHGATTVLPQTITNPNSKVHVISNVTLVSKSQPPHHQSISFVNSSGKHVHGTHTQQQQQPPQPRGQSQNRVDDRGAAGRCTYVQISQQPRFDLSQNRSKCFDQSQNIIPRGCAFLPATTVFRKPAHQQQQQLLPVETCSSTENRIAAGNFGEIQICANPQQQAAPVRNQQQYATTGRNCASPAITHAQIARNTVPPHQPTANVIQIQKQNAIGKSNLANMATVKAAATTTIAPASIAKKHQTVKLINQATSVVTPQGNQQYTIQSQHVPINHQIKTKQTAQQRVYLTSSYNNEYHYQHTGVQQSNEHANKNGPEYFRVNTSDIQSTTSTFVDNIPLISARTDEASGYQQHGQDDDIIGEEVRPLPIDSSMDSRMRALHALLQDHTYVQLPKKAATATTAPSPNVPAVTVNNVAEPSLAGERPSFDHAVSNWQAHGQSVVKNWSKHGQDMVNASGKAATATTQNIQGKTVNATATYVKQQQQLQQNQQQNQLQQPTTNAARKQTQHRFRNPKADPTPFSDAENGVAWDAMNVHVAAAVPAASTAPPLIPGFPFIYNDDDAHSVISTGSRNNLDIDMGEETETAPEGEGEDDSVTRCICELAHDDGYMICCDKCSVWQHVDCMGIDRQNIPEEYKCELCQPRPVDHNRARTLQLMKRKEQQNFLLLGSGGAGVTTPLSPSSQQQLLQPLALAGQLAVSERTVVNERTVAGQLAVNEWRHTQLNAFSTIAANKKKGTLNKKGRKDKGESGSLSASKRKRSELSASRAASAKQRREAKKASKRKSASNMGAIPANTIGSPVAAQPILKERNKTSLLLKKRNKSDRLNDHSEYEDAHDPTFFVLGQSEGNVTSSSTTTSSTAAATASDKQAANLRTWIENYEAAMTNHYSPELRARLHAMGKQTQSQNNNTMATMLKQVGSPENKCTTVPHAGGKILISTLDIYPKNPVIEMRGKYMLSTQYQAQQQTTTMTTTTTATPAALTVANGTAPSKHTAGPFLFFYRLPNDGPEICVDTRTYGNEARFVRRSCRPNAEILHTIEKGTLHLYIVSLATIKSSTEITIKHEPHDLEWLARGEIAAPTSTICACGLIKECPFGASGAAAAANANPNALPASIASSRTLSTPAQKKLAKRSNGHIKEKISSSSSSSSSLHRKKKSLSSLNRNRSRSSSSDHVTKSMHNNCSDKPLPGGNVTNCDEPALNAMAATAAVSAEVTSAANALSALASSPKQRALKAHAAAGHQKGDGALAELNVITVATGRPATISDEITTTTATGATSVATPPLLKSPALKAQSAGVHNSSPHMLNEFTIVHSACPTSTSPTRPVLGQSSMPAESIVAGSTPSTPDKKTEEKILKSPPSTPVSSSGKQRLPTASKPMSHKKSARKSTCSMSEDNSSVAGDEFAVSSPNAPQMTAGVGTTAGSATKKEKEPKKVVENKKLTREERKMEAIVRAFEKMEKTEQRKNEQNKKSHPTASGAGSGCAISNASTSSRKRSISSSQKDKIDDEKSTPTKRSNLQQKRKRKRGKSYSQPNQQRRRRNRHDSQNSEIGTSEDSTSTFMMSPTLPSPVSFDYDSRLRDRRPSDVGLKKSPDADLAADLLLSLSTYGSHKNSSADHSMMSPKSNATSSASGMSAFPISSACLLIEAAVGPLGHDFKLPTKAKTKKTIMNEWLHQSDASAAHSPHSDITDQHMLSPNSSYGGADSYMMHHDAKTHDQMSVFLKQSDHSISMAAQKIEEFIQLSTASSSSAPGTDHIGDDDESSSKWSVSNDVQTVPTPMPTPPLQLGSSVKKRWLRQAISEECSDEMLANSSATSSPPNGFMAPLKKRRVARQCSDLDATDDLPSPNLPASSHDDVESCRIDLTTAEMRSDDAGDEAARMFVKMESEMEPIETKPDVEIVDELKNEDIKAEHSELPATVEDVAVEIQTEEQKVEIKMEVDVDVEVKEKVEAQVDVEAEAKAEEPKPIAEVVEQKYAPINLVDSSSSSGVAPVEPVERVEREHERAEHVEKAEIVKIKKIEDNDNNNTEYPSVTALHDVPLPKDEIEDIQQKLHSFHSENLMILQSRNKKRLSRATTPTSFDVEPKDFPLPPPSSSSSSVSSSSTSTTPSKCHKTSIDERDYKTEESSTMHDDNKTSPLSTASAQFYQDQKMLPVFYHDKGLVKGFDHGKMPVTTTAPALLIKSTPIAVYNSHWTQRNADGTDYSSEASGAAKMYQQQQTILPPSFTAIHPHLGATNASTPNSLYQYLDNPNRPTNYTTMAYGTPSNVLTADQSATTRPHSMFGAMHPNIPAPTLLNSSNYLTKSYSTLSEPTTPVSVVPSPVAMNITPTAISSALTPKVLTRTQSADPRLNPPKDLPPVTPKRKLSINEYRKRKQLISGGTGADKAKTPETPSTPEIESSVAKANALDAVKPKNGLAAASETKETVFSPAPTLLELQQESLSQRLKSYKSLHEMSTSNLGPSKPKEAATENDELNLLRNLEASAALSSSNSSSLRSSPSLKSFDGEDNSTAFSEPNEPCRDVNIETDDLLANDIHSKSTTCDIPPTKKTSTQSAVTAITSNVNNASDHIVDTAPTIRDDENTSAAESQTKCEPSSAGNISPNENTSR